MALPPPEPRVPAKACLRVARVAVDTIDRALRYKQPRTQIQNSVFWPAAPVATEARCAAAATLPVALGMDGSDLGAPRRYMPLEHLDTMSSISEVDGELDSVDGDAGGFANMWQKASTVSPGMTMLPARRAWNDKRHEKAIVLQRWYRKHIFSEPPWRLDPFDSVPFAPSRGRESVRVERRLEAGREG